MKRTRRTLIILLTITAIVVHFVWLLQQPDADAIISLIALAMWLIDQLDR